MNDKFCAGIIIRDDKVLLLKRSAKEDEPHKWCPINGGIEDNEPPEKAVVREAKEEIGLDFTIIKPLPMHTYKNDTTHVFLGSGAGIIKIDPEEVEDYGWFSYKEAIALIYAYGYEQVIDSLLRLGLIK